ncbi:SpoIIE family protein phosphatase [Vallicoccus soli]|uniref:SpoIIE family protein phosphatase n=1 Tax=Vallicoccus soli TaxID=2339232 RepID=UPI00105A6197|nr:SpoIIE family protein phosphatase [Vallicoccus soli]
MTSADGFDSATPAAQVPAQSAAVPRATSPHRARRRRGGPGHSPALDRIAGLAARLLSSSSAQVSLLTEVQTVAGGAGLPTGVLGADTPLSESLCAVTAALGRPLVVADAEADERVAGLPPVTSGAVRSYLGVPLIADGTPLGALCVFNAQVHSWSESDINLLEQLAASAVAELELTALNVEAETSRLLWELAIEAGGVGTFDWDLASGKLSWDDRLVEMFGYRRDDFDESIEAFNARVHPADRSRVSQALQEAIDTCGVLEVEYRILLPEDTTRWVGARGRALCDEQGRSVRLLGAAYDITGQREVEARLGRVLESMSAAFYSLNRDWRFTYVNAEAERLLGRPREELLGGVLWELFPAAVGSDFETNYRRVMATNEPVSFDAYYPAPLNGWYELRVWPSEDGLNVYFLEVTARRAAQEHAEAAALRAGLLAEVSEELSSHLEPQAAAKRLARLVVPTLADWCVVSLAEDSAHADTARGLQDVATWHTEPDMAEVLERCSEQRLGALAAEVVLAEATSDRPVAVLSNAAATIAAEVQDAGTRQLLERLAPDAVAVLPLGARGRTVGVLSLYNGAERGPLSSAEQHTAREVAERAGLALDNARLYRQQRRLAEELQRAMFTAPPEPDHMQVVVRYQPATEAAQVGGDWYDAFLQPDGATAVVIGDVVGHDVVAAAAMGQVRTLLRGIAADRGESPAQILSRVDHVMETLQVGTTATAVLVRFEQSADERERGITRMRWSNAGHPPPMIINPDSTATVLAGVEADLLLGIEPRARRIDAEVILDRGATLLLYTDGLVERRGQSLEDGLNLLRDRPSSVRGSGSPTLAVASGHEGPDLLQSEVQAVLCDGVVAHRGRGQQQRPRQWGREAAGTSSACEPVSL